MKPVVALVGRPNVGKSTLFNRLAEQRLAVVDAVPGTTRDRLVAEAEWAGVAFDIVDTGGIDPMMLRTNKQLRQKLAYGAKNSFFNEFDMRKNIKSIDLLFKAQAHNI